MQTTPAGFAGPRMDYREALEASGVLELLKSFDPRVVGTLPLDLALESSDIDIVCAARDPNAFAELVWQACRSFEGFRIFRWREKRRPVVARFVFAGWPFELFADPRPVDQQGAWRHFEVERRLLAMDDGRLRAAVWRLRRAGLKTEPAFAQALELAGDPYEAMLFLYDESDAQLRGRLAELTSS